MNQKSILKFVIILLIFLAVFFLLYNHPKTATISEDPVQNLTYLTKTQENIVLGNSLTGLIENGESVKILYGYYNCNK